MDDIIQRLMSRYDHGEFGIDYRLLTEEQQQFLLHDGVWHSSGTAGLSVDVLKIEKCILFIRDIGWFGSQKRRWDLYDFEEKRLQQHEIITGMPPEVIQSSRFSNYLLTLQDGSQVNSRVGINKISL